ncbi:hypothetical protein MSBR3_0821 [Methanosarcina barkeri 3]|uniref:Uncharacterized protein n=1 Tax=Methanosarcina barkeri 3 TaxID=1434107 RepID=A0A0E3SG58_METBA|nr:DUF6061 family protein [Methanosarcina barkeri]AKB81399.1 hypothetical protein MSBR3_0821 [Methanosarcina barkeri 3]
MKIIKCKYNWDDGTVDVFFSDRTKLSLICKEIEAEIDGSIAAIGWLEALKIGHPLEYAQMVLNGVMQEYCRSIDRSEASSEDILFYQYKKRYPDMSDSQIQSLVREAQMYNE